MLWCFELMDQLVPTQCRIKSLCISFSLLGVDTFLMTVHGIVVSNDNVQSGECPSVILLQISFIVSGRNRLLHCLSDLAKPDQGLQIICLYRYWLLYRLTC